MRAVAVEAILSHAAPVQDVLPWQKAWSWSGGVHAALLAGLLLMKMTQPPFPTAVLTEVNLIEKPAPAPPAAVNKPVAAPVETAKTAARGIAPQPQVMKAKIDVNTNGAAPMGTGVTEAAGEKAGAQGSIEPLSGPIVAQDALAYVGHKTGALVELSHRAGGTTGSGAADVKGSAKIAAPIALGKMGVDELRQKESAIGAPLVSQSVVDGSVGAIGGKNVLGGGDPAARRKAELEALKANPLDEDKWGKQKGPFSLEGPLKYRKILKMELPPYPRWAEEKGIEASVSIRLWVDARGHVKDNMYLEKTSGYSELDHVAMEALKAFVFVPIPSDMAQDDEWGVATFQFQLKH